MYFVLFDIPVQCVQQVACFCRKYGTFVSKNPTLVLCLSLAIPLLLCIGLIRFKVETRPQKVFFRIMLVIDIVEVFKNLFLIVFNVFYGLLFLLCICKFMVIHSCTSCMSRTGLNCTMVAWPKWVGWSGQAWKAKQLDQLERKSELVRLSGQPIGLSRWTRLDWLDGSVGMSCQTCSTGQVDQSDLPNEDQIKSVD